MGKSEKGPEVRMVYYRGKRYPLERVLELIRARLRASGDSELAEILPDVVPRVSERRRCPTDDHDSGE